MNFGSSSTNFGSSSMNFGFSSMTGSSTTVFGSSTTCFSIGASTSSIEVLGVISTDSATSSSKIFSLIFTCVFALRFPKMVFFSGSSSIWKMFSALKLCNSGSCISKDLIRSVLFRRLSSSKALGFFSFSFAINIPPIIILY